MIVGSATDFQRGVVERPTVPATFTCREPHLGIGEARTALGRLRMFGTDDHAFAHHQLNAVLDWVGSGIISPNFPTPLSNSAY